MDAVTNAEQTAIEREPATMAPVDDTAPGGDAETLLTEELLVEEVSIDGMCGVY